MYVFHSISVCSSGQFRYLYIHPGVDRGSTLARAPGMILGPRPDRGRGGRQGSCRSGRNAEAGKVVPLAAAATTLAETIRVALAEEIITGRLAPGTEIEEQQAAERFGASRTPVREALRELAAAGLVTIEPRRGVRVAALTLERLGEMFEVMAETEAMCARLATHRMTAPERFALQALHEQLGRRGRGRRCRRL